MDAQLCHVFKGHEGPVVAMAIDPSSTLLATGKPDTAVSVILFHIII